MGLDSPRWTLCGSRLGRMLDHLTPEDHDRASNVGTAVGFGGLIAAYLSPWIGLPIAALGTVVVLYAAFCPRRTVVVEAHGLAVEQWPPERGHPGWIVVPRVAIISQATDVLSLKIWLRVPLPQSDEVLRIEATTTGDEESLPKGIACPVRLERGESARGALCFPVSYGWTQVYGAEVRPGEGSLEIQDRASRSSKVATVKLSINVEPDIVEV